MRFRDEARTWAYARPVLKGFGPSLSFRQTRHPALDGARGLAVLAMVMGHTLDALLAPAFRDHPWVQEYWKVRGITAPLFLLVSGWAVVMALGTKPGAAKDSFGRRFRRALLLLFLGYLLHWPGWGAVRELGFSDAMLRKVFQFDALQCIGAALLLGAMALVVTPNRGARALLLGGLAVGIPLASVGMWNAGAHLPVPLQQFIGNGEGSRFPFFPWAGFFFAGAFAAHGLHVLKPGLPQGFSLLALGGALLALTRWVPVEWTPTSPTMVMYRVAQGLLVLGVVNLLPQRVSCLLAPLGRLSLWIYVLHLPVVYGWADIAGLAQRIGPRLGIAAALGTSVALLVGCYLIARMGRWVQEQARPWRAGSTTLNASVGTARLGQ
ncbi:DUF1624 domain-containing protein [Corallococcus sp. AB045]|nr:DUF1624 domain-containing protein [Corallococcus sp. AB045]